MGLGTWPAQVDHSYLKQLGNPPASCGLGLCKQLCLFSNLFQSFPIFSHLFHLPFRTLLKLVELCPVARGDGLTSGGEADLDVSQRDACDAGDLVTSGSPWLSTERCSPLQWTLRFPLAKARRQVGRLQCHIVSPTCQHCIALHSIATFLRGVRLNEHGFKPLA